MKVMNSRNSLENINKDNKKIELTKAHNNSLPICIASK